MVKQIFIGLFVEGTTDSRFLEDIVTRTAESISFEAKGNFQLILENVKIEKGGKNFLEQVLTAAQKGLEEFGMMILCVHSDGDSNVYESRIKPAKEELAKQDEQEYCKILVAIVPVQEVEAWMLADIALLKKNIGTDKSDTELGLHRPPESVANPKELIKEAIRIARLGLTRKRRNELKISDLYLPIGQSIDLEKLEQLPSYLVFKEDLREAFRQW
ncbi:MAG: hypothetical protein ACKVTZ_08240 [Bacteroidia bacterium]